MYIFELYIFAAYIFDFYLYPILPIWERTYRIQIRRWEMYDIYLPTVGSHTYDTNICIVRSCIEWYLEYSGLPWFDDVSL